VVSAQADRTEPCVGGDRSDLTAVESPDAPAGFRESCGAYWAPAFYHTAAQTIDGDKDRGPFKHFHQPVEKQFVIVMSWLKIFFKNLLGLTNGLNGQFLIAHGTELRNSEPLTLFHYRNRTGASRFLAGFRESCRAYRGHSSPATFAAMTPIRSLK
jgi:hypothetical protein